mgnify:FL=1
MEPFFADVNVAGVNKAMGINEFASYYGFDVSRTIAFGDGGNDISMIRAAGMGIAMGGASEAVKSVADYITEAVDENGVRNAWFVSVFWNKNRLSKLMKTIVCKYYAF